MNTPSDKRRLANDIERVADKIYNRSAVYSRELSAIAAEVAKLEMAAPSARKESDGVDWRMRAERAVASLRSFDGPLADYIVKISTTDGSAA